MRVEETELTQINRELNMKNEDLLDVIIIGAGPAGLQAGHYLGKMGFRYIILEAGDNPGTSFETHPRHRKLISINKVYTGYDDAEINLRWDWNSLLADDPEPVLFKQFSKKYFPAAEDLLKYLTAYAEKHELKIRYRSKVALVRRPTDFVVETESGDVFNAKAVIVATGVPKSWLPNIPGIEHAVPYSSMSIEQDAYINKHVLILGKGNSGFETADHLTEVAATIHICSPSPLKLAWSTHFVGHLRAVNNTFLDTYQLKSQNAVLDATITKIERNGEKFTVSFSYQHAEGEIEEIQYDSIIACTGFRFDAEIFSEECRPQLCAMGRLPAQKANWESANVPDLFFAGTIMQYRDYKKYMSGFIHGFRYNVRTLCHLLREKYVDLPYPAGIFTNSADVLLERIASRINSSSGLWQQPGFLGDVFASLGEGDDRLEHREELPIDYVHEKFAPTGRPYLIVTLEFGSSKFENPFNVPRIARDNIVRAESSNFLHPVVRLCCNGRVINEHHVIEDLAGEWKEPEHLDPLKAFLRSIELTFNVAEPMVAG